MGEHDCDKGCKDYGFACNVNFKTLDSTQVFKRAGVECKKEKDNFESVWARPYHPFFRPSSYDNKVGQCVGYKVLPQQIQCSLVNVSSGEISEALGDAQRLCDCVDYSK